MKRSFVFCVAAMCLLTFAGCAKNDISDSSIISEPQIQAGSEPEPSAASPMMSYNEMKDEIEHYLNNHNDISKMYDSVRVRMNNDKLEFEITLQAYETYTFAAVTSAATDIVRTLVGDNGIEEYRLWVHSPSDAIHTISWISFNLEAGLLNDKGYNGNYDEMVKLGYMLDRYGYED